MMIINVQFDFCALCHVLYHSTWRGRFWVLHLIQLLPQSHHTWAHDGILPRSNVNPPKNLTSQLLNFLIRREIVQRPRVNTHTHVRTATVSAPELLRSAASLSLRNITIQSPKLFCKAELQHQVRSKRVLQYSIHWENIVDCEIADQPKTTENNLTKANTCQNMTLTANLKHVQTWDQNLKNVVKHCQTLLSNHAAQRNAVLFFRSKPHVSQSLNITSYSPVYQMLQNIHLPTPTIKQPVHTWIYNVKFKYMRSVMVILPVGKTQTLKTLEDQLSLPLAVKDCWTSSWAKTPPGWM